jgi:hypothetical protein
MSCWAAAAAAWLEAANAGMTSGAGFGWASATGGTDGGESGCLTSCPNCGAPATTCMADAWTRPGGEAACVAVAG